MSRAYRFYIWKDKLHEGPPKEMLEKAIVNPVRNGEDSTRTSSLRDKQRETSNEVKKQ